ncbi:MAG: ABC transporter ATP-binding protein/permease [Desulfohalobiaceae bacterium]|nr:ABC transporter ATP-binding protein/permease [Desulfohalobiaceae bacterium]
MNTESEFFAEQHLEEKYNLRVLGRLLPFVKPYRGLVIISMILVALFTVCELAIPYFSKVAIDNFIVPGYQESGPADSKRYLQVETGRPAVGEIISRHPGLFESRKDGARIELSEINRLSPGEIKVLREKDLRGISLVTAFFLLLILFSFIIHFAQQVAMELTGQRIMHRLRMAVYEKIQTMSFAYFNRNPVGRLVTRATNDVQNMYEFFTSFISFVFKDVFMLLGIALVLVSLNWKLALVSFSLLPFTVYASALFARRARDIFRVLRIKAAEINTRFSESIDGIRVIQLFQQERTSYQKMHGLNRENYQAGIRQIRMLGVFLPLVEFCGFLAMGLIILYGGSKVMNQSLSLGTLVAFLSYIRMFFRPLRDLAEKFNILQNALTSAERIFQILDNKKDQDLAAVASDRTGPRMGPVTSLEFRNVSFAYNLEEQALSDISFRLKRGEHLALVGPTGSGKSTLVSLLAGFYSPQSGAILINDKNLEEWDIVELRSRMALILQDQFLFSGTVRENILQGNPNLGQKELEEILRASNAEAVIKKLPRGLETSLQQGGGSISSGQRQLISIARAFARDSELLILDEATSAIDSETEGYIQEAIQRLMQGRTCITIAHRPSAARSASRIMAMHQGRIIESGTHQELIARKGFYYSLRSLQA